MLKMRLYVDGKWLCELNNYPNNKKNYLIRIFTFTTPLDLESGLSYLLIL